MLLIVVFAIFVISTRRVRITRSMTITGDNARNFGIGLLALTIPLQGALGFILRTFAPASTRAWPIPQTLYVVLFSSAVLFMAYYFRNPPAEAPGDAAGAVLPKVPNESPESSDQER